MTNTLFPTTVIGSLPRPAWVREVILDRKSGQLTEEEAGHMLDPAIEAAVILQERAGLDEITDGEWRRESYVKVFAERVRGFQPDLNPSGGLPYPAVVAPVEYHRPIATDEVHFIRGRTQRRVKATLPAPYIIGRRMWHPEHSKAAYPTRERLMADCVSILRQEIELLRDAGADTVQLDEPWLSTMVDPNFREKEGVTDPQYEMDLCVDLINQTLDGIEGIDTMMHLCHAHFDREHGSEGPYDLIMPALAKVRVGTICMEYATPVAGGLASLAQFPENVKWGLGCIDHCDRQVETPEVVASRVEEAMQYVDKERITLNPDCGFAPSVQNPMDLDEAYLKLKAMCQAAELLRNSYRKSPVKPLVSTLGIEGRIR
ncbi:cobalamin-independent methionine synthase II family protein [Candidatus Entotheonella palauensis]|uniref:cobalamin-independent methionine synthase II family protein n=1 Tax=Candidatus Entotheonella palauensis TaxID=93172 RepID=UPI0015C44CE4|nr:cobalamin-independent methionine synthase II family protein [Candidatus Entotheonella palauensis]